MSQIAIPPLLPSKLVFLGKTTGYFIFNIDRQSKIKIHSFIPMEIWYTMANNGFSFSMPWFPHIWNRSVVLDQRLANNGSRVKFGSLPVFVIGNMSCLFIVHGLWLFLCYSGRVEYWQQKLCCPESRKYLLSDLCRKKQKTRSQAPQIISWVFSVILFEFNQILN